MLYLFAKCEGCDLGTNIIERCITCIIIILIRLSVPHHRCKTRAITESALSDTRYAIWDSNRSNARATVETLPSYARYTIADSNRSKTYATTESILSNTRYTIADSNRSNTRATTERLLSDTCYPIDYTIISYSIWDLNDSQISTCYFYSVWGCRPCNVVAQSVHLEIVGGKPYGYR